MTQAIADYERENDKTVRDIEKSKFQVVNQIKPNVLRLDPDICDAESLKKAQKLYEDSIFLEA